MMRLRSRPACIPWLVLPALAGACAAEPDGPRADENGAIVQEAAVPAADSATDWNVISHGARTMVRRGTAWEPALFLCDGTDRPVAYAVTMPGPDDAATLVAFSKSEASLPDRRVTIAPGQRDAVQTRYALVEDGRDVGSIEMDESGVASDRTTPAVASITVDGRRTACRWQPETRFAGITAARSVLVTGDPAGPFSYRSFDFDRLDEQPAVDRGRTTRATITVTRGARTDAGFRFRTGATDYLVRVAEGSPGGAIAIGRDGRDGRGIVDEPLLAYTLAGSPSERPVRVSADYVCTPGPDLSVTFDNRREVAGVAFAGGRTLELAAQRSGSGFRYVGDGYELRGKGRDMTLTGPTGEQRCRDGD